MNYNNICLRSSPTSSSGSFQVEMFDEGALVFQQKASAFPAIALDPPRGADHIWRRNLIVFTILQRAL